MAFLQKFMSVAILVVQVVYASPNAIPAPTPTDHDARGYDAGTSPKPTLQPLFGRMAVPNLFKRQARGTQTCGYIDGAQDSAVSCTYGYTCRFMQTYKGLGCCTGTHGYMCNAIRTSCIDGATTTCDLNCLTDDLVRFCPSTTSRSWCLTYIYPSGYTDYGCATSSGSTLNMQLTYSGQSTTQGYFDPITEPTNYLPGGSFTNIASKSSSGGSAGGSGTGGSYSLPTGPSSGGSDTTSSTATSSKKKTANIGVIVGGAVGGFAVLAIFILGIFFILRSRRKNVQPPVHHPQVVIQAPQAGMPPQPAMMYQPQHPQQYNQPPPPQQQYPQYGAQQKGAYEPAPQYDNYGASSTMGSPQMSTSGMNSPQPEMSGMQQQHYYQQPTTGGAELPSPAGENQPGIQYGAMH